MSSGRREASYDVAPVLQRVVAQQAEGLRGGAVAEGGEPAEALGEPGDGPAGPVHGAAAVELGDAAVEEGGGVAGVVAVEAVRPGRVVEHLGGLVDDDRTCEARGAELVDVGPQGVAAHRGADDDGVAEVEVLQQLTEVAAVAGHALPVGRRLGLAVGSAVEGDGAVAGGEQRVDGERPRRRGRGVAVHEHDRAPLSFVGEGERDVVGGAEGRHGPTVAATARPVMESSYVAGRCRWRSRPCPVSGRSVRPVVGPVSRAVRPGAGAGAARPGARGRGPAPSTAGRAPR